MEQRKSLSEKRTAVLDTDQNPDILSIKPIF